MDEKDLVILARETILSHFGEKCDPAEYEEIFAEKCGAFVTIKTYPSGELRGCIGYILPIFPLAETIQRAAESAAFGDPRFPPLSDAEDVTIEISILTVPEPIICLPEERNKHVCIGVDGLVLKYKGMQGLLLPQVATEYSLSSEEFLKHVALKAGVSAETVYKAEATVSTFQVQIWGEETPGGAILEKTL